MERGGKQKAESYKEDEGKRMEVSETGEENEQELEGIELSEEGEMEEYDKYEERKRVREKMET